MRDPAKYRTKEEVEEYKLKDPIETIGSTIFKNEFASSSELDNLNEKIIKEIDDAVKFAEDSPYPDPSEIYTDNYKQENYPFLID